MVPLRSIIPRRVRHLLMKKFLCGLLLLATFAGCATAPKQRAATQPIRRAAMLHGTFGTYDNEPRLPDHHVDEQRLVAELADVHAETYHWLIWHNADDWADMQKFL